MPENNELAWVEEGKRLVPGVAAKAVEVVEGFEARVQAAGELRRDIQHLIERAAKEENQAAPGLRVELEKVRHRQEEHTALLRIEASAAMRAISQYVGFTYAQLGYLAREEARAKASTE